MAAGIDMRSNSSCVRLSSRTTLRSESSHAFSAAGSALSVL